MKTSDLLNESYSALTINKVRSALTMLGIIIGIASVIAMVSVGQGTQASINANIESLGSNLIVVTPGAQRGFGTAVSSGLGSSESLTLADEQAIAAQVQHIQAIDPELSKRAQITAKGTNTNAPILGTTPAYLTTRNLNIDQGSFFTDQNNTDSSRVVVLGPTVATNLFNSTDVVGQTINIGSAPFTIIGVTQSKGGNGFSNQDNMVYIPINTALHYLGGTNQNGQPYVSTISISADNSADMAQVQQDVTNLLLQRHGISDPTQADFTVQNQADIVATASSITGTFTLLLASIAGISLLVGGIGIMNMMLTTVTERTREIGLRKAIGAKRGDINMQFLTEAIFLTFTGGVIGTALGWLIAYVISHFAKLNTVVSAGAIILAFCVSAGIGLIFGYYPARRASKLNPIEALRFE